VTITVTGMSTWKGVAVAVRAAQHVRTAPTQEQALVPAATCMMVFAEAELILAHQEFDLVLVEHACALVEAVAG